MINFVGGFFFNNFSTAMASPQKENGFVPIANEIIEHLVQQNLSGQEFRIVLWLMRKTYGYNKKVDFISLTQFGRMLGVRKTRASVLLRGLRLRKIVTVVENINGVGVSYSFNKNYEDWIGGLSKTITVMKKTNDRSLVTQENRSVGLSKIVTTKDNKDNIQKTLGAAAKRCLARFGEFFKKRNGFPYHAKFAKDTITFKHMLNQFDEQHIFNLMEMFFESDDPFIIQSGYTVGVFSTQINKLHTGKKPSRLQPPKLSCKVCNGTGFVFVQSKGGNAPCQCRMKKKLKT